MLLLLLLLTLPAVVQAQSYTNSYGIWNYATTNDSITITNYSGPGGDVTIPDRIPETTNGLPVTSIGDYAFIDFYSAIGVTIPNGVISIGVRAFAYCFLTSVTIPNSVTTIGDGAFLYSALPDIAIPNSVTSIGKNPFDACARLTAITVDTNNPAYSSLEEVLFNKSQTALVAYPGGKGGNYTIPNSVTSIGTNAFDLCNGLTNVIIPNSVTSIEDWAFGNCFGLARVTIPASVTSIGDYAFTDCANLTSVYFQGNAPSLGGSSVFSVDNATVYYLPGTTGWSTTFGGRRTALWIQVPTILMPPQTQTAEANSAVGLWVQANGSSSLCCLWYLNYTNFISWSTNWELELTNVQFSRLELTNVQFAQSGAYTAVITNVAGAITSSPALLNVIAPVERRPVPGVKVTGEAGSLLNVDYASSLSPAPNWATLGPVSLTSTSQYCFDLTLPLPPQRFFRAWQTGTPGVMPSLDLHLVPAFTLTGNIGGSVRVDYINRFGPTDAWVTQATVTLTNTSQPYFDVSALGQPQRLYRLVQIP